MVWGHQFQLWEWATVVGLLVTVEVAVGGSPAAGLLAPPGLKEAVAVVVVVAEAVARLELATMAQSHYQAVPHAGQSWPC